MTMRVKLLQWDDGDSNCYCMTICGMLDAMRLHGTQKWVVYCDHKRISQCVFDSREEAKSFAWAWYGLKVLGQVEEVQG